MTWSHYLLFRTWRSQHFPCTLCDMVSLLTLLYLIVSTFPMYPLWYDHVTYSFAPEDLDIPLYYPLWHDHITNSFAQKSLNIPPIPSMTWLRYLFFHIWRSQHPPYTLYMMVSTFPLYPLWHGYVTYSFTLDSLDIFLYLLWWLRYLFFRF